MGNKKEFVVFAGVNGAGKTSIYKEMFEKHSFAFEPRINPDEMIQTFQGEWKNPQDQVKSGKLCLITQREYFKQGISFHRETTFSSQEIIKSIQKALDLDYEVSIYFVHVETVDIALERVAKRVRQGGHGISDSDVARRHVRSVENIVSVVNHLPVKVYFYDNSGASPRLVGRYGAKQFKIYENVSWLKEIYQKVDINSSISHL